MKFEIYKGVLRY